MACYLGVDTSNYTTSAALYVGETGEMHECRRLLEVKEGEKGLQQSNAVFQHVRALPGIIEQLIGRSGVRPVAAVGASVRPRDIEGSYMPCFSVGAGCARATAAILGIHNYEFSHQAGHIAAALFSVEQLHRLAMDKPFAAFHVSGGTTEVLLVSTEEHYRFSTQLIAQSLDLKAGQLIDRVGQMLRLGFPAGPALERLASESHAHYKIRPTMRGADCCLSGVENQCTMMYKSHEAACDIAAFCLQSVLAAIDGMTKAVLKQYPGIWLLYAGGVMSNTMIREQMMSRYDVCFAKNGFSSDNAAGIAMLTKLRVDGL